MREGMTLAVASSIILAACAGRDPQPIARLQPQDLYSDCTMIRAGIEANNAKPRSLQMNAVSGCEARRIAANIAKPQEPLQWR
jgi:hypothetical protein